MAMLLWGAEQYLPSFRGILEFEMHLKYREDSLLKLETLWPPQGYWEEDKKPWRTQEKVLTKQMWQ